VGRPQRTRVEIDRAVADSPDIVRRQQGFCARQSIRPGDSPARRPHDPWHNMLLPTAHGFAEMDRVLEETGEGGRRAAAVYALIESGKLNDVNPQAWLAFVLARLPDHLAEAIDELPPWNWKIARDAAGQPTPGYRRSLNEPPSIA
jgi:hypothetical protein